jgi:ATP-dependent DNA helicase PIF1
VLPCVTGVGKSYTLKRIIQYLRPESYTVTSSTGCSAAIIGATTLHSALGLGLGTQPVMAYVKKITKENPHCYERIRCMRTLIIDEVSMLDGKFFDKAGTVVAHVRRNFTWDLLANAAPSLAWDGMQLILCGDFMQLPPVKVRDNGWIFDAKCWAELGFKNHLLTMIHRQHGDGPFAEILARMRMGQSTAADLAYVQANSAPEPPEGALQLFAVNAPADHVNEAKMRELVNVDRQTPHKFTAIDAGPKHLLAHSPAPKELWLCKNARCICLKNIDVGIANGSLGTVQDLVPVHAPGTTTVTGCRISVLFDGVMGGEPILYTFSTYDPEVPNERVLKFSIRGSKDLEVASRIQIPLRLAWACTIHRSQGMSLNKVIIDFDRVFETGQSYTALSRVTTLAGCFIKNLTLARMRCASHKSLAWYNGLRYAEWV